MVLLRCSEEPDSVEEVEKVRPLEEGEWVVSTVSRRSGLIVIDLGELKRNISK